jgi:nitrate/TMAO reductase-like tetraheme cytochrome c subunit
MKLPPGDTTITDAYVTCITCHDQHSMVAVKGNYGGVTGGVYQTYFFVRGPYNPGAPYDKTHAPSTMQFCRQCHFPQSNEAYGDFNIGTAF